MVGKFSVKHIFSEEKLWHSLNIENAKGYSSQKKKSIRNMHIAYE